MHLSSLDEYGLRCLTQVARHEAPEPLNIAQIAAAEGISAEYAAKLMRILRQGDLVTSTRGAGGGYRLARSASEITVWQVLQVLGNPLFSASCGSTYSGQLPRCVHGPDCTIRVVWGAAEQALRGVLDGITLADMNAAEQGGFAKLGTVGADLSPAAAIGPVESPATEE